jgi:hypothetical protein
LTLDWSTEPIKTPVPSRWIAMKTNRAESNIQQATSHAELFHTEGQIAAPSTCTTSVSLLEDTYVLAACFGAILSGTLTISRKRSFVGEIAHENLSEEKVRQRILRLTLQRLRVKRRSVIWNCS